MITSPDSPMLVLLGAYVRMCYWVCVRARVSVYTCVPCLLARLQRDEQRIARLTSWLDGITRGKVSDSSFPRRIELLAMSQRATSGFLTKVGAHVAAVSLTCMRVLGCTN